MKAYSYTVEGLARYEFLVLVDGEKEVVSVDTEGDWNSARTLVEEDGYEVVKSLQRIDMNPQEFLAW